jgi:hypothetical protein
MAKAGPRVGYWKQVLDSCGASSVDGEAPRDVRLVTESYLTTDGAPVIDCAACPCRYVYLL